MGPIGPGGRVRWIRIYHSKRDVFTIAAGLRSRRQPGGRTSLPATVTRDCMHTLVRRMHFCALELYLFRIMGWPISAVDMNTLLQDAIATTPPLEPPVTLSSECQMTHDSALLNNGRKIARFLFNEF